MIIIPATYQFSAHCDTGWVLYHISIAFTWIPFKSQKGTPTIVTPST